MVCAAARFGRIFRLALPSDPMTSDSHIGGGQTPPHSEPPSPGRRHRWRNGLLASLVLVPLLVLGALLLALHSERGSRALWQLGTLALQGHLSGTYVAGTVAQGMELRALTYQDGATRLRLDRFEGRWRLSTSPLKLTVDYLRLGKLELHLPPAPEPAPPPVLPQDLRLPLALQIRSVSLQQLQLQRGVSQIEISQLRLSADSDRVRHSIHVEHLETPYGTASAQLQLNGSAPFALSGGAELAGGLPGERYQAVAHLSGTLAAIQLELNAESDKLHGHAEVGLAPFSVQPLLRAQISADHIDPQLFNPALPHADLSVHADLKPLPVAAGGELTVAGPVTLENTIAGTIDADRLPLVSASLQAHLSQQVQQLSEVKIQLLKDATLTGGGVLQQSAAGSSGEFQLQARALDLHALHSRMKPTQLRGPLTVRLQPKSQQLSLTLADAFYQLQLQAEFDASQIQLKDAQLKAGAATLKLSGTLARDAQQTVKLNGKLSDFDPALWLDTGAGKNIGKGQIKSNGHAPSARINLDFDASGALAPLQAKFKFGIHDSSYDQLPLSGGGTLNLSGQRLLPSELQLDIAGNQLALKGSFGAPGDRLQFTLQAPQLQRLGYGLAGLLQADGEIGGTLQQPKVHASYRAEKLVFGVHRLDDLTGRATFDGVLPANAGNSKQPMQLAFELDAHGYRGPDITLEHLQAKLSGSDRQHALSAEASGKLHGQVLALKLAAHGGLSNSAQGYRWDGSIDALNNQGQPRFRLEAPAALSVSSGRVVLDATKMSLAGALLDLKNLAYEQGRLRSEGAVSALSVASILQLQTQFTGQPAPVKTDLVLDGNWKFELGERASGFAQISRRSGDIQIENGRRISALGLSTLQLRADLLAAGLKLDLQAVALRIGNLSAQVQAGWQPQAGRLSLTSASALTGRAKANMPNLKAVAALAGPQLALDGSLAFDVALGGTLAQPKWSGAIAGDGLAVTLFDLGIQLHDGVVRIGLKQNEIDLQKIEFHGGEGTLRASGRVQLDGSNPADPANPILTATIVADRLQLFASPERRLTLSGQAKIAEVAQQLHIDGKVTVDRALFDLPKKTAPKLGDDVIVVRRQRNADGTLAASVATPHQITAAASTKKPANRWSPVVDIAVDLGRDFRFRGVGADLLLRGAMAVHSEPYLPLRATGTVRVEEGTYEVFGRKLAIERGLLNFQGPIDNPNINILAMRRNQEVEAGVEVTGLAQQPRVRLVSEPNVGDEEKLSWLMFGHGSDANGLGQQQAAGAALALLGNAGGKRIAQGIGLDEFSIGASESGLADQQVVNLGKALSERFYVGYEQSLTGAASIVKMTYQISRRWSLVARAGAISGLDLLFNKRFD